MDKRGEEGVGSITIFCRNFFVSVPKHFVEQPFCAAFQKISGSEKVYGFMDKSGGGGIKIFRRKFFVSAEIFGGGTL